jgi:23S rRNA pseudouridine2605 synthase
MKTTMTSHKLHKILAQSGLGSRRDMEALIEKGEVRVNGQVATLGARISEEDQVMVGRRKVRLNFAEELPRVLLYHKPEGEIVSRHDPDGRASVFDQLPPIKGSKWVNVGRLDFNTSGLLIFTNQGELANRMAHPSFEVEREYSVRLVGELTLEQLKQATTQIDLEDGPARFESLRDGGGEGTNHWYHVVLKEGRNREVRRMFEAMHLMVGRLIRTRFGGISLPPRLRRGQSVELPPEQVKKVMEWLGMKAKMPAQRRPQDRGAKPAAFGRSFGTVSTPTRRRKPAETAGKPRTSGAAASARRRTAEGAAPQPRSSARSTNTRSSPAGKSSHRKGK